MSICSCVEDCQFTSREMECRISNFPERQPHSSNCVRFHSQSEQKSNLSIFLLLFFFFFFWRRIYMKSWNFCGSRDDEDGIRVIIAISWNANAIIPCINGFSAVRAHLYMFMDDILHFFVCKVKARGRTPNGWGCNRTKGTVVRGGKYHEYGWETK